MPLALPKSAPKHRKVLFWPTGRRAQAVSVLAFAVALAVIAPIWQNAQTSNVAAAREVIGLFPDSAPAARVTTDSDTSPVELGVKFSSASSGSVTGAQVYKTAPEPRFTPASATLWDSSGQGPRHRRHPQDGADRLADRQLPEGRHRRARADLHRLGVRPPWPLRRDRGRLDQRVERSGLSARSTNNGVFRYGRSSGFPTRSYEASNYWVDVTFINGGRAPEPSPSTPAPTTPVPTTPAPTTPVPTTPAPDDAGSDDSGSDEPRADDSGPDDSGSHHAGPDDAGSDHSGSHHAGPHDPGPHHAGSDDSFSDDPSVGFDAVPHGRHSRRARRVGTRPDRQRHLPRHDGRRGRPGHPCQRQHRGLRPQRDAASRRGHRRRHRQLRGLVVQQRPRDRGLHREARLRSTTDEGSPAVGSGGYTARRVEINGLPEGFRVGGKGSGCGPVSISDSYAKVVRPDVCGDWHGDGLQGYDGPALTLRSTTIDARRERLRWHCALLLPDSQGNTSVDIDGLLVTGGGYSFRNGMPGTVRNLAIANAAGATVRSTSSAARSRPGVRTS